MKLKDKMTEQDKQYLVTFCIRMHGHKGTSFVLAVYNSILDLDIDEDKNVKEFLKSLL